MKIDLSGKLAIVSGSTAGIGLGISKSLAEVRRHGGGDRPRHGQGRTGAGEHSPESAGRAVAWPDRRPGHRRRRARYCSPPNRVRTFW